MDVRFTPDQEDQLSRIAAHSGTDAEDLVREVALHLVAENARYSCVVREGVAQADRGEFIEDEQVADRLEQQERSARS